MSGPSLKLPRGAEQLLRDFPLVEPDFDAQAKAIEARLQTRADNADLDDVLGVPELEAEAGEPAAPAGAAAKAPARSLTEMARRSLHRPEQADDSAALARELFAATSQARRPDAAMVARVRAAGKAAATVTPLPGAERPSGVVARRVNSAAEPEAPAVPLTPATNRRRWVAGAAAAVLAVAAGVSLLVASGPTQGPGQSAAAVPEAPSLPAAPPKQAEALAPAGANEPSAAGVLSPEALAVAPPAKPSDPANPRSLPTSASLAPAAGLKVAPTPGGAAAAPREDMPPAAEVKAAAPTTAPPGSEPAEPQMRPAQGSAESMPVSPSSGAVSTALGAVRGDAQACLAGQSGAVVAVVTFGSDGRVTRVTASGPSGACIQGALSKARLAPFAKDQFSATTTIRPP